MIPKIIHYCWFGRGQMPDLAIKCIKSWQQYLPDYIIAKTKSTKKKNEKYKKILFVFSLPQPFLRYPNVLRI